MKKYERPMINEEDLELVDVIAVSNGGASPDGLVISADDLWS